MVVRVEIYDWNGTADRAKDENSYLRYVIAQLIGDLGSGIAGVQLADGRPQLSLNLTLRSDLPLDELRAKVEALVPSYPIGRREGVNHPLLKRARVARRKGIVTGILSAGWTDLIATILQNDDYLENPGKPDAFDFIIANEWAFNPPKARSGYASLEFQQGVYGEKGQILKKLFEDRRAFQRLGLSVCGNIACLDGIDISEAAYIGDSTDDFSAMDVVGYPALSPIADPEFIARAERRYGSRLFRNYRRLADHWEGIDLR